MGNLELWNNENNTLLWQSGTSDGIRLAMQQDGNLVIHGEDDVLLWASQTGGNDGAFLVVQDDGNLVIYSRNQQPLWATNTNPVQPWDDVESG
jgi:hypothetical protein